MKWHLIEATLHRLWYQHTKTVFAYALMPLAWCYVMATWIRKKCLETFVQWHAPVPIIVVGNLSVGGVGKTPLVMAIVKHYQTMGKHVGVVSRGYRARLRHFPHAVSLKDEVEQVGDEACLMARTLTCPIMIAPRRTQAVQQLLATHPVQLIISDDGLQHYALGRTLEIVVIDGHRLMGNGLCLPAGPLREPITRLKSVTCCVINGGQLDGAYTMTLQPVAFRSLVTNELSALTAFKGRHASAIAGIGHPEQFFLMLQQLGLTLTTYPFSDHHAFVPQDFESLHGPIIMTEKDAVKCSAFAKPDWYSLVVEAQIDPALWTQIDTTLLNFQPQNKGQG